MVERLVVELECRMLLLLLSLLMLSILSCFRSVSDLERFIERPSALILPYACPPVCTEPHRTLHSVLLKIGTQRKSRCLLLHAVYWDPQRCGRRALLGRHTLPTQHFKTPNGAAAG
jgi:hypothetical protein